MSSRTVTVRDKMQKGYRYQLAEQPGRGFDPEFCPQLTPKQMLQLGVFLSFTVEGNQTEMSDSVIRAPPADCRMPK
jgi:hypothetical protein